MGNGPLGQPAPGVLLVGDAVGHGSSRLQAGVRIVVVVVVSAVLRLICREGVRGVSETRS